MAAQVPRVNIANDELRKVPCIEWGKLSQSPHIIDYSSKLLRYSHRLYNSSDVFATQIPVSIPGFCVRENDVLFVSRKISWIKNQSQKDRIFIFLHEKTIHLSQIRFIPNTTFLVKLDNNTLLCYESRNTLQNHIIGEVEEVLHNQNLTFNFEIAFVR